MARATILSTLILVALVAACGPATQDTEDTPSETASLTTPSHADVLNGAANLDAFVLAAAQLAQQRAARADIKAFASTVLDAHRDSTRELGEVSEPVGLGVPWSDITVESDARLQELSVATGTAFDALYLDQMTAILQTEIDRQERFVADVEPQPVATWATSNILKLRAELDTARALKG